MIIKICKTKNKKTHTELVKGQCSLAPNSRHMLTDHAQRQSTRRHVVTLAQNTLLTSGATCFKDFLKQRQSPSYLITARNASSSNMPNSLFKFWKGFIISYSKAFHSLNLCCADRQASALNFVPDSFDTLQFLYKEIFYSCKNKHQLIYVIIADLRACWQGIIVISVFLKRNNKRNFKIDWVEVTAGLEQQSCPVLLVRGQKPLPFTASCAQIQSP